MTYTVRDTETGETVGTFPSREAALAAMAGCSDLKLVES